MGKCRPWSSDDDTYLRMNYGSKPTKEIAAALGRTPIAIRGRCKTLGVRIPRKNLSVGDKVSYLTIRTEPTLELWNGRMGSVIMVSCECSPDKQFKVLATCVRSGRVTSCGCRTRELQAAAKTTHGCSRTPLYRRWTGMMNRCYRENVESYKNYGGRGIKVCDEWHQFENFRDWALANGYQRGLHVERRNNNESYSPDNCYFDTPRNNSNNKRNNKIVSAFGEDKTVAEWSRDSRCQVPYYILKSRLKSAKWDAEAAISTPVRVLIDDHDYQRNSTPTYSAN